jgi:hypothetical protein
MIIVGVVSGIGALGAAAIVVSTRRGSAVLRRITVRPDVGGKYDDSAISAPRSVRRETTALERRYATDVEMGADSAGVTAVPRGSGASDSSARVARNGRDDDARDMSPLESPLGCANPVAISDVNYASAVNHMYDEHDARFGKLKKSFRSMLPSLKL